MTAPRQCLIKIWAYDRQTGLERIIRVASAAWRSWRLQDEKYLNCLTGWPNVTRQAYQSGLIGGFTPGLAVDFTLADRPEFANWRRDLVFDGRRVEVFIGTAAQSLAEHRRVFVGVMDGQPEFQTGKNGAEWRFRAGDLLSILDNDIPMNYLGGTGGINLDGDAAGKGAAIPRALGQPLNMPIVILDKSRGIGQAVDGSGLPVNLSIAINKIYVRGRELVNQGSVIDVTTATFDAVPGGDAPFKWQSNGRFVIGAAINEAEYGAITADVTVTLPSGTSGSGSLARALFNMMGVQDGDLDLTSFAALDSDVSMAAGLAINGPSNGLQIVSGLLDAVLAYADTDGDGRVIIRRLTPPNAASADDCAAIIRPARIVDDAIAIKPLGRPPLTLRLGIDRAWTVQSREELAGYAQDQNRGDFTAIEYRYSTSTIADLADLWGSADTATIDSYLRSITTAGADGTAIINNLVATRHGLLAGGHSIWRLTVVTPVTLVPGDQIWLNIPIAPGRAMRVIGVTERFDEGVTELQLLGAG